MRTVFTDTPSPQSSVLMAVRIAALAAIAIFLYFTIRLTASDLALKRAQRDLDAGRIEKSVAAYATSQRWHPGGSSDDLYFSRALAGVSGNASNQAFLLARNAAETSEERQNAWYNLAGFYAARNDAAGVESCLRRSVDASPNWFKSHLALARLLLLSGRRAEGVAEADRAANLDGAKDPEIAKFLQSVHDYPVSRRPQ